MLWNCGDLFLSVLFLFGMMGFLVVMNTLDTGIQTLDIVGGHSITAALTRNYNKLKDHSLFSHKV